VRLFGLGCVLLLAACAQGKGAPGDARGTGYDAPVLPDSTPRIDSTPLPPDAPRPDAPPGTPDAAPRPDAPGTPDAAPRPDAPSLPDAPRPPDAPSPPDAPGCTDTWVPLLVNGNFDLGPSSSWVEFSSYGELIVQPPTLPVLAQTLPFAVWMGGADNNNETLQQDVTVPSGATALRLRGQYYIVSQELFPGIPYDFLYIQIRNTSNTVLEALATYDDDDENLGWTAFTHNASTSYAGQTIRLFFNATTDVSEPTNFFIDSLVLEALVCQ